MNPDHLLASVMRAFVTYTLAQLGRRPTLAEVERFKAYAAHAIKMAASTPPPPPSEPGNEDEVTRPTRVQQRPGGAKPRRTQCS